MGSDSISYRNGVEASKETKEDPCVVCAKEFITRKVGRKIKVRNAARRGPAINTTIGRDRKSLEKIDWTRKYNERNKDIPLLTFV